MFMFILNFLMLCISFNSMHPFQILFHFNTKSCFSSQSTARAISSAKQTYKTGSFIAQLPHVHNPEIHYKRSLKYIAELKLDPAIKNVRNAHRKLSAKTLDCLMTSLTVPITRALNVYKHTIKQLHPFEQTVVELTLIARMKAGQPTLEKVLSDLKQLRKSTCRIGKDFASRAHKAASAIEAKDLLADGMSALQELYSGESIEAHVLNELIAIQMDLSRIPAVELNTPTVVLVGAPNVGKSSIVRAVSTGTPEVNDYPFTTRGVTIGHIVDMERDMRLQVMDTPGLLDRPSEERNEMEKLTFASMAHLPTAVIYVIDPSGLSGDQHSSLQAQLNVRAALKQRFPHRPWIDVISKADIELSEEIKVQLPANYLSVSAVTGYQVKQLKSCIESMLMGLKRDIITKNNISTINVTHDIYAETGDDVI